MRRNQNERSSYFRENYFIETNFFYHVFNMGVEVILQRHPPHIYIYIYIYNNHQYTYLVKVCLYRSLFYVHRRLIKLISNSVILMFICIYLFIYFTMVAVYLRYHLNVHYLHNLNSEMKTNRYSHQVISHTCAQCVDYCHCIFDMVVNHLLRFCSVCLH